MRKLTSVIIFIFIVNSLKAQELQIPAFGTDSTFEVLTWNIEWFPKNGQTTVDYVVQIIQSLDVDLLALQEIGDTLQMKQVIDALEGYAGYFKSDWYGGLAYIYKTDEIRINSAYEIYTTEPYWRPFPRSPLVVEIDFMYEKFIVINNHLKCCGDEILDPYDPWDEETRRLDASNLLEEYIRTNFSTEKVILLGDLNDNLTDEPPDNVFVSFLNNAEDYLFVDLEIAEDDNADWSYPTWPSHIDHILITDDLFNEFSNEGSDIQTITIDKYFDGGWHEYEQNVSDHRPVALKIKTDAYLGYSKYSLMEPLIYPNPCRNSLFLKNSNTDEVLVRIMNLTGEVVKELVLKPGDESIDVGFVDDGMYLLQITGNGINYSSKFVKAD